MSRKMRWIQTILGGSALSFSINELNVTGDSNRAHTDRLIDIPAQEFFFNDLYMAMETKGWIDLVVD